MNFFKFDSMIKYIPTFFLGIIFLPAGVLGFFNGVDQAMLAADTSGYLAALTNTGTIQFVKFFEVVGAVLILIPRTRAAGFVVLAPIIANIIWFHVAIEAGHVGVSVVLTIITLVTTVTLWDKLKVLLTK